MYFVRRAFVEIGQTSIRRGCRFYCNAAKQFKRQNPSAAIANQPSSSLSNNNAKKEHTENENGNDNEHDDDSSEQSGRNSQTENNLMVRGDFDQVAVKNRETFLQMLHMFIARDKHRRHHCEFIYAALKHTKEFGVERDLEVYKEIMHVFPKGKFIPTNMFQAEFMHYPKQQECAVYLLNEMECNAVMPDAELETIIANVFGKHSQPMYKFWRMAYWMPKFKFLSPWLLPDPVPDDTFELAKLAVRQMCTVDVESEVHILDTETVDDSLDKTWIVSGQSPEQRKLLRKHAVDSPLKVEGPFAIWLRNRSINYFTLVGEAEPDENFVQEEDLDDVRNIEVPQFLKFFSPTEKDVVVRKPTRSIHQQDDGTIYAICATGTSTKDSLLSWIRLLETNDNPSLAHIPVLFKFRAPVDEKSLVVVNKSNDTRQADENNKK